MTDLVFTRTTGLLIWSAMGGKWNARTGPYGYGALPSGQYSVGRTEVTAYTSAIGSPFRDGTGKGFFVPIYPQFATTRGASGGRLGIHPDGNVPGTSGCIGITNFDCSSFYRAIKNTPANITLMLEVV